MPASLFAALPLLIALLAGAAVPFSGGQQRRARTPARPSAVGGRCFFAGQPADAGAGLLLMRAPLPQVQQLAHAPWWAWFGGVAGVLYITAALVLTPRLGAAGFIVCVVAGQVLSSLLIDQFGLMGLPERPVNLLRLAGVGMIVIGMIVVQWGTAR